MKLRFMIVFILTIVFLSGSIIYAQAVPAKLQVKLILKIVSMDRNFGRFGDPVKIGVSSDAVFSEFKANEGKVKVKGKDFIIEKMASLDDITNYKVAYVDKNWSNNYSAAAEKATANKTLIFCNEEDFVVAGGGAISFKVVSGKPKIVINLKNVKDQGTDFPANFLKITVVVGGLKN
ncbi:MAG: YfiR family protein [bacterium]|nr:YfiR family protein [bacterium]